MEVESALDVSEAHAGRAGGRTATCSRRPGHTGVARRSSERVTRSRRCGCRARGRARPLGARAPSTAHRGAGRGDERAAGSPTMVMHEDVLQLLVCVCGLREGAVGKRIRIASEERERIKGIGEEKKRETLE